MARPEPECVIDLEQTHTDLSSAPALIRERVRLINLPQVCKVLDRSERENESPPAVIQSWVTDAFPHKEQELGP
ncbi:hypothetical protein KOW79_002934 [Hemibagrus wyckioides]|uniref:Uncharacterized protein n=1 Tax=Hemibagrus wyckioides TaxID=337641 RepID=A0A9D3P4T9_9TELE|nr:hypothetical protein KOW79_002934 [Hemibagrus wyckioides]